MKYQNIDIGERIKHKFDESNLSISKFAKLIRSSRSNVYNIFNSKSIDIDKLILISEALNHDFIQEYVDNNSYPNSRYIVSGINFISTIS